MSNKKKYNDKSNKPVAMLSEDWFYINSKQISVKDISAVFDSSQVQIEIWEEAGVLELDFPDKTHMDFEETEPKFKDQAGNDFLEKHQAKSLFYVTFEGTSMDSIRKYMLQIIKTHGGIFCADTEDFNPLVSNQ